MGATETPMKCKRSRTKLFERSSREKRRKTDWREEHQLSDNEIEILGDDEVEELYRKIKDLPEMKGKRELKKALSIKMESRKPKEDLSAPASCLESSAAIPSHSILPPSLLIVLGPDYNPPKTLMECENDEHIRHNKFDSEDEENAYLRLWGEVCFIERTKKRKNGGWSPSRIWMVDWVCVTFSILLIIAD